MRAMQVREEMERALGDAPMVVHKLAEVCAERSGLRHGGLVWVAGEAVGGAGERLRSDFGIAAAAMEMLVWFARLHGEVPPNSGWKPLDLMLTRDFFYAKSLSMATSLPREVAPLYAELACRYATDSLRLRERSNGQARTMREELEHAFAKSGRWTATCCRIGALLSHASAPVEEALTSYGFALGMLQHLEATPPSRREEVRSLIASYRKRAASHLSALAESEAKRLLLQAVHGQPCDLEKRRAFLNV